MVIREDYLHLALWVEQEILEKIKSISIYYRGKFLKKDLFLKTTMRYHFTPVRMVAIQKSASNKNYFLIKIIKED